MRSAHACKSSRASSLAHSPPARRPTEGHRKTLDRRSSSGRTRFPQTRPLGRACSGRPIGMSTAMITGRSGRRSTRQSRAIRAPAPSSPVGAQCSIQPSGIRLRQRAIRFRASASYERYWHAHRPNGRLSRNEKERPNDHPPAPQRALHARLQRPRAGEGENAGRRRRHPRPGGFGRARRQGSRARSGLRGGEGRRLRRARSVHPRQRHRYALAFRRSHRRRARRARRHPGAEGAEPGDARIASAAACSTWAPTTRRGSGR